MKDSKQMEESVDQVEFDRRKAFEDGVVALMQFKSQVFSEHTAFVWRQDDRWREMTYGELAERVGQLSDFLIEHGIRPGERIAILSESRPEWAIALFAAIRAGAVAVPLDARATPTDLDRILADCEPSVLFVSPTLAETLLPSMALRDDRSVFLLSDTDAGGPLRSIHTLKSREPQESPRRLVDETALIAYTSGTTGDARGVMISFRNLGFQVMSFEGVIKMSRSDMLLSLLPLNHLLELTCGLLGPLYAGAGICYFETMLPGEVARVMREKRITCMVTVPLLLRLLKIGIEKELARTGRPTKIFFDLAFRAARFLRSERVKRLLFRRLHASLGGSLRAFISGGAPLEAGVAAFFDRVGLPVYQGYGLTETSPVVSVNTPENRRIDSVGRPLPGVAVRIRHTNGASGEGEVLTRGPHVMQGYYRRPDLTAKVMDSDGWFHTGDLGRLDGDGFLHITGRIKNLIVLESGKKVSPEEVEEALGRSALIKEVCVLGLPSARTGQVEICAVVVPADAGSEADGAIETEVAAAAQLLAAYKRPVRVVVRHEDLPRTTSRKIRRQRVIDWLLVTRQPSRGR